MNQNLREYLICVTKIEKILGCAFITSEDAKSCEIAMKELHEADIAVHGGIFVYMLTMASYILVH